MQTLHWAYRRIQGKDTSFSQKIKKHFCQADFAKRPKPKKISLKCNKKFFGFPRCRTKIKTTNFANGLRKKFPKSRFTKYLFFYYQ